MMATRLQYDERAILDAFDRAIRPLDDTASSMTLNDRLLDLIIDELVSEDDPARVYCVEPWMILIDICTPSAYELAMLMDDCDQAGYPWHSTLDQLLQRHEELVAA